MPRHDPIRERYYDPVEKTEEVSDWLFGIGAALSLVPLLIDKSKYPAIQQWISIVFAIDVILLFAIGLVVRLYLTPRADDKRRKDFLTNATKVDLTHEKTVGYYNNDLQEPSRRLAAQVLENSHFSKAIVLKMAKQERIKVLFYGVLWIVCLMNRQTDLDIILAASQAVFSEQMLSKLLRTEWLRMRYEKTFEDVYRLFQSHTTPSEFDAMALESLLLYESSKSNGGIVLSSAVFNALNDSLSDEWEKIKKSLNI